MQIFTQMRIKTLLVSATLLLLGCVTTTAQLPPPPSSSTTIVSTGDGDTLRINRTGEELVVRLACIDAPEKDQPGGAESAARLADLLPIGQVITIREVTRDRYERMVAEVYVAARSINLQMVEEGHAVVYGRYLDACSETQDAYLGAEEAAMASGLNFWATPIPVMPWEWRRGVRTADSINAEPPACIATDCDCGDFDSQSAAQAVLNGFEGDPHRLDRDGNGVACEALR